MSSETLLIYTREMSKIVNRTATVVLPPDLRRSLQDFVDKGSIRFSNVSEAYRALFWRGLFLDERPAGKWSESAWLAAYQEAKLIIVQSLYQRIKGESFEVILEESFKDALGKLGGTVM